MDHNNIENEAYGEGQSKQFAITSWAVKNRRKRIPGCTLAGTGLPPARWMMGVLW